MKTKILLTSMVAILAVGPVFATGIPANVDPAQCDSGVLGTDTAGDTVELRANWRNNKYKIAFNANGGTGSASDVVCTYYDNAAGGSAIPATGSTCESDSTTWPASNAFSKTGYTFLGYSTTQNAVTGQWRDAAPRFVGAENLSNGEDPGENNENLSGANFATVDLYAIYDANVYDVDYDCGTGATGPAPSSTTAAYDAGFTPAANTCTKSGYTFAGWCDGTVTSGVCSGTTRAAGTEFTWNYTDDVTFTAIWTQNNIDLVWEDPRGAGYEPTGGDPDCNYDDPFNVATPAARTGYTFVGWDVVDE